MEADDGYMPLTIYYYIPRAEGNQEEVVFLYILKVDNEIGYPCCTIFPLNREADYVWFGT